MKNALILVLFLGGILGIYVFLSGPKQPTNHSNNITGTSPPQKQTNTPQPSVDVSDLRAGGSSYLDPQGRFVFLYPADYTLDEQNEGKQIRIYKRGPSQKGQTEMYDGVIMVLEPIFLEGQSLSAYVDQNIQTNTADGTSEIVQPKKSLTIGTYNGYSYLIRGLGVSTNYFLQKDPSSSHALLITMAVHDPTEVGFQKEVDKIIATIELLK